MDLFSLILGIIIGFIGGSGFLLFYMRWKMTKQIDAMQQDMEGMFDMTEDMMNDLETEEIEVENEKEE
ncbi:MAG: hypothetical protein V5A72_02865 [Candidatus Nanohaloarchaea archaeon]